MDEKTCDCKERETYNGWTNWETWAAKLWIENDEGTYNEVHDIIKRSADRYEVISSLKALWDDMVENVENIDRMTDSRINWDELADAYIEDGY